MIKGTVKFFDAKRGFGFITGEDEKEYFVHYKDIANVEGYKKLLNGQNVNFEVAENDKGKYAVNVNVIQ